MSEKKIDQPALQKLFEKACMLDIRSLKPGNVNTNSPSKNLNYLDFLKSIEACSDIITQPNILLEDRIFESIKSTINIVGTNTNLGIILLCAPIIQAYYSRGGLIYLKTYIKKSYRLITTLQKKYMKE